MKHRAFFGLFAVFKTISLDASKVINVSPRYSRLRADHSDEQHACDRDPVSELHTG